MSAPPPLPARPRSPPPYSTSASGSSTLIGLGYAAKDQWLAAPDPRSSSAQSLRSTVSANDQRRTLLLVYIHGFYGNKQSFRSFPHHVHLYLKSALADSHVIHSKIYPRYKTYRAIEVARDNFSEWLIPHESPTTDVILVGHSMGGILAAEVALMPNQHPSSTHPFKHRILGTISLDSPFLGLHPGIIVAGISSLFQPAPQPPTEAQDDPALPPTLQPPNRRQTADPFYDPPFWNDNPFKEAPFIKRITNFARKHRSEGLVQATTNHIVSHLEYGGCLADFNGLRRRYDRIRALEDVDELEALGIMSNDVGGSGGAPPPAAKARVRFVNYYTLSTGRPPKPKSDSLTGSNAAGSQSNLAPTLSTQSFITESDLSRQHTQNTSIGEVRDLTSTGDASQDSHQTQDTSLGDRSGMDISLEEYSDHSDHSPPMPTAFPENNTRMDSADVAVKDQRQDIATTQSDFSRLSMQNIDPVPMEDTDDEALPLPEKDITAGLPPIPESPIKPADPELDQYTDKDTRKQVEREYRRKMKVFERAVKDRNRAIRERQKLIEKRRKKIHNEQDDYPVSEGSSISSIHSHDFTETQQQQLLALQHHGQVQNEVDDVTLASPSEFGSMSSLPTTFTEETRAALAAPTTGAAADQEKSKKKKNKKFCTLPSKVNGAIDPTWVDVYMDGVDEVGAHCGLFFSGPHYDKLVGDVSSRVIGWVQDDMTKRAILDLQYGVE